MPSLTVRRRCWMAYYIDLFSPETFEAFNRSDRSVSGVRVRQRKAAGRIHPGDKLVCYMTKLSRWVGILQIESESYEDDEPLFYPEDDPFVIRFKVRAAIWLEKEKAVPIKEDHVWSSLSFTRGQSKTSHTWTGKLRGSLVRLDDADGEFLEDILSKQVDGGDVYPVDKRAYQRYLAHRVRRQDGTVAVTVPEPDEEDEAEVEEQPEVGIRESIKIQALLADIGSKMGFRVWVPRSDRARVEKVWNPENPPLLEMLPLNYDDTTLRTIEQIDVIWLRGRAITRAFEVEHTTSVYSGILRMADLLALQPNMDIRLHIVAPAERREKVFTEIRRPVFSLLDRGPLAESCTYVSYESVRELAEQPYRTHLAESVLDEYAEEAE